MAGVLDDIADPAQLVRYATRAQLELLKRETGTTQEDVASLAGQNSPANFAKVLKNPSDDLLRRLDEIIVALAPNLDRLGGLSALAVRLRRLGTRESLTARIPPTWAKELLLKPADDELDILIRASALLSVSSAIPEMDAEELGRRYGAERLREVVDRLILIGASPPTPRNVDALILLGSIAGNAFDLVKDSLDTELQELPLGFRVWRAVTTVVRLNQDDASSTTDLRAWVKERLEAAEDMREMSLFPARSLDLELAIAIPLDWSPPGDDWVEQVLRRRAGNEDASVRERGTAALGLWERAVMRAPEDRAETEGYLRGLIESFRSEAELKGGDAKGLRWVADTLEHNLDTEQAVSTDWPQSNEPCRRVVQDAVEHLGQRTAKIPKRILIATRTLVEHAVLQNEGVYRRQAIDTLAAGGWTKSVNTILNRILRDPDSDSWLRCRAVFAMGFLQDHSEEVAGMLKRACQRAMGVLEVALQENPRVSRGIVSEVHTALFALGDCFGTPGAEKLARELRQDLDPAITALVRKSRDNAALYPVSRAAAYLITVTAQDDTSRRLLDDEPFREHPDAVTERLRTWALKNRFDEEGVRPLHATRD
jgi:hypothetical protein